MIVIIDNYDSFTYNLVQYFKLMDSEVRVHANDHVTIDQITQLNPAMIVLSPGPGKPADSGMCNEILQSFHTQIPVLGVCLGHQVIADFFGGSVEKGQKPMHGKVTPVFHTGEGIFRNIGSPTTVTRYHSLVADDKSLPDELEVIARTEDQAVMAVQHRFFPVTGIQFHPESIMTPDGFQLLANCYQQALEWKQARIGGQNRDAALSPV